jgi:hypothetical protein
MRVDRKFVQSVVLLVLTAVLTGVVTPFVLKEIDSTKAVEQKRLDADLARQQKLIEAQSKFLDEFADTLWKWRYISAKVAYHGARREQSEYLAAVKAYRTEIWETLSTLRKQISRSRRLISDNAHGRLVRLYSQIVTFDDEIAKRALDTQSTAEVASGLSKLQERIITEISEMLEEVIDMLANEMGLKAKAPVPPP